MSAATSVRHALTRHSPDDCRGSIDPRELGHIRYFKCRVCKFWVCAACEGGADQFPHVCDVCWSALALAVGLLPLRKGSSQ